MLVQPISTSNAVLTAQYATQQRQKTVTTPAIIADAVTISPEARALLASSSESIAPAEGNSWFSDVARRDPKRGEELARDFAYIPDSPTLDGNISDEDFINRKWRYLSGEMVTKESESYFNGLLPGVLRGKISIYETEMAKGTPPAEIIDKIIAYMDSQPEPFKRMINW